MPAVIVNEDRCQSSQVCVSACPFDSIGMIINEHGRVVARIRDTCVDCMLCVSACPEQAISLVAAYGMPAEPSIAGGVWVLVPDAGASSLDVVTQAARLAQSSASWVGVLMLESGHDQSRLQAVGADVVLDWCQVFPHSTRLVRDNVLEFVDTYKPEALLVADCGDLQSLVRSLADQLQVHMIDDAGWIELAVPADIL